MGFLRKTCGLARDYCAARVSASVCACFVSAANAGAALACSPQHLWKAVSPSFSKPVLASRLFSSFNPDARYLANAASAFALKPFQTAVHAAIGGNFLVLTIAM